MGIFLLLSSLFLGPLPKVDESNLPKVLEELRGEVVIVATHHPSYRLDPTYGTAFVPDSFRSVLRAAG